VLPRTMSHCTMKSSRRFPAEVRTGHQWPRGGPWTTFDDGSSIPQHESYAQSGRHHAHSHGSMTGQPFHTYSRGTFLCDFNGAAFSPVVRVRRPRPRSSDGSSPGPPLRRHGRDRRVRSTRPRHRSPRRPRARAIGPRMDSWTLIGSLRHDSASTSVWRGGS